MTALIACERFSALGTRATVAVDDPAAIESVRATVENVIADFDLACSRFREDSELSAVNRAGSEYVPVSPLFVECAAAALRAARLTDGDVDPTVGEALLALGYDRDFDQLGGTRPAPRIAAVPGWHTVKIDCERQAVCTPRGVKLDFGATAKALAADRAASAASELAGCGVLVSLGGDIAVAGGAPGGGWRVRVTDDHRADETAPGQWISLKSGGLATSSTAVRRWQTLAGPSHHLIDPATGLSARAPWRTVSVAAGSCLDANIASTAAIIRGERASAWLESLALPSRLVSEDGTVLHLAGWTREGDDLPRGNG
jgi:thiamine biosynthesis lipoprotein